MKKVLGYSIVVIAVICLISCAAEEPAQQPAEVVVVEGDAGDEIAVIDLETVEVSADGTGFEVPVQIAQIPEGAWFCDMGTVHFARLDEGDGKCPVCGMKLVQRVAGMNQEIVEEGQDEVIEMEEDNEATPVEEANRG